MPELVIFCEPAGPSDTISYRRPVGAWQYMDEDIYFKKELSFNFHRQNMRFRVSQDLFSSFQVDIGTLFLLRSLLSETDIGACKKILDIGCGYGPIGLTLKKLVDEADVHMVDRDALAVEYTRQNAELNRLAGVRVYGSLGYDEVTGNNFDLIISNIPGKAGESVISYLLRDAAGFLDKGGLVAIVVITPLESTVAALLESMPDVTITFRKSRSGHAVFFYTFNRESGKAGEQGASAFERGIYRQDEISVSCRGFHYSLETAWDIPEHTFPGFRSELLLEAVSNGKFPDSASALLFNPGQGHVPVAFWQKCRPARILLNDRDLLSLRYTEKNLILNGCPAERIHTSHRAGIGTDGKPVDVVIGTLRENEGTAAINEDMRRMGEQLAPGGTALLAASSTAVTRVVNTVREQKLLSVKKRERRKGNSFLLLERK